MPSTQSNIPQDLLILVTGLAKPGSDNSIRRTLLQDTDFYVCPGHHHGCSLHHKCGGKTDLYCASWGCETLRAANWNPTSSWDYITVSWNFSRPQNSLNTNPLCKNSVSPRLVPSPVHYIDRPCYVQKSGTGIFMGSPPLSIRHRYWPHIYH